MNFPFSFAAIVGIAAVIYVFRAIRIVRQYEKGLIETFGQYSRTAEAGLVLLFPPFQAMRTVDMREQVMDVPPQEVITKDNASVTVDAVVYFQVTDPAKVVYNVANFAMAAIKLAQTNLRNIVGELELDQTLTSRERINTQLRQVLDEATDKWGVKVVRVEIQKIEPPQDITNSMSKQMKAEREKRANILEAEGFKQAAILKAEGSKEAVVLAADGEKQSMILRADGQAESMKRIADAEKYKTEVVYQAIHNGNPTKDLIAIKYLETLQKMSDGQSTKILLPLEMSGLAGTVAAMVEFAKDPQGLPKKTLSAFWLFLFPAFLVLVADPPRISGYLNPFDEGLWLGAAQGLLSGQALYRDIFFHYGLILAWFLQAVVKFLPATVSVLRGSFWVINSIGLLAIYYTLLRWVEDRSLRVGYSAFLFCIPLSAHVPTIPMAARYATGFLPLFLWPGIMNDAEGEVRRSFWAGFLAAVSFFTSQEVGVSAILANAYIFCTTRNRLSSRAFVGGLAAVFGPLTFWLMGTHRLEDYVNCTILETGIMTIKRHYPAPRFFDPHNIPWFIAWQVLADSMAIYLPALLYVGSWMAVLIGKNHFSRDRRLLIGLLIYGTLASMSAWDRSDRWHIYFALSPALLLLCVWADRKPAPLKQKAILAALCVGAFLTLPHALMRGMKDRVFSGFFRTTTVERMGTVRLPIVQAQGYEYLVNWTSAHVKPDTPFLFFPYDGNVYYLANRPNPVRYPVLALACTPALQAKVVRELSAAPPEWVIWDTENTVLDGVPIQIFLNQISDFIQMHYVVREKTGPFLFLQYKAVR